LRGDEIDPVFRDIQRRLHGIELEPHGIETIP
jgi:hypothetical protein